MLLIIAGVADPLPRNLQPMLATPATTPPEDEGWAFEIKWDGVRALAYCEDGALRISSRRGEDASHRYPELTGLPDALGGRAAILDGEVVAFDAEGRPSFQTLQKRMGLSRPETIKPPLAGGAGDLRRLRPPPPRLGVAHLRAVRAPPRAARRARARRRLLASAGAPDRRRASVPRCRPRPGTRRDRLQAARHPVPARAGEAPTGSRSARAFARSWSSAATCRARAGAPARSARSWSATGTARPRRRSQPEARRSSSTPAASAPASRTRC